MLICNILLNVYVLHCIDSLISLACQTTQVMECNNILINVFYLLCHLFPRLKNFKPFMFPCMSCFLGLCLALHPFDTFYSTVSVEIDAKTEYSIPVEALTFLKLLCFLLIFHTLSPSLKGGFYHKLAPLGMA